MTRTNAHFLGVSVVLVALASCVTPLPTVPPRDTYVDEETPVRPLSGDEKSFVDGMNGELAKLGMPPAVVGGYEMDVAAVLANLGLSKIYQGSAKEFAADKSDDVSTLSQKSGQTQTAASVNTSVRVDPYGFLSEAGDIDLTRLHRDQHLASRGLPFDGLYTDVQIIPYEQRGGPDAKELLATARRAHFYPVYGELRIGVAIIVDGSDNKRFYSVAIRDVRLNIVKGAPRMIETGGTFELAGQVIDHGLTPLMVGVQGPKTLSMDPVEVAADGSFHTTIKLPADPGLFVVSLGRPHGNDPVAYNVAVFAGVDPTPWPFYPKGSPTSDAYALAEQVAQAANAFRQSRGLPALTIPADLAGFEKKEAESYGETLRATRLGNPSALKEWMEQMSSRIKAAGFDPARLDGRIFALTNIQAQILPARFPSDAIAAYRLGQPDITELGLGVAAIPRTADPTQPPYVVSWAAVKAK
jgi:uncharacterized protein YkwD